MVFDENLYNILTHLELSGSLTQTVKELSVSCRSVWVRIKNMEDNWGIPLVYLQAGADTGSRTRLTSIARELLQIFRSVQHEFDHLAQGLNVNSNANLELSL